MKANECSNCYGTGRDYKLRRPKKYGFDIPRCSKCQGGGVIREAINTSLKSTDNDR